MTARLLTRSTVRLVTACAAIPLLGYAALVASAWRTYGHPVVRETDERDELLDRFIPVYDVVERHRISIAAPAQDVLSAAAAQDFQRSPLIRAIFKTREVVLRASPVDRPAPQGLLAMTLSMGWAVLAERPGREIVVGAVTRPWEPNVVFRPLPPDQFAAYSQPGDVKIVWTLRADPVGKNSSIFMTETRAVATDATARAKFRKYWAFASPGIATIRRLSLRPLKRDAERRAKAPVEQ